MSGQNTKSYYVTTPIYYVNDKPHIGHAYTTIACDVLARFKRLDGYQVLFLTGTDEHGQKVAQAAEKAGITPQQLTDQVSQNFKDLGDLLNFSNDDFIRTTEERHKKAAQELWRRLEERGAIYLDSYSGWYAVRDEAYYAEDELTNEDGRKLAPTGAEVEWMEEESYFFRLSDWGDKLLSFYEGNPGFILPASRRNEVMSFVKGGLRDLSVSRTKFDWGVPVPGNDKHVMYVWIDALTNYLTAAGFPDESSEKYKQFWPADVHMVGKDIIRFHAVYWPAFLMAAGLPLPKRVFAHGWWTIEGQKMSKSLGNVIAPDDLVNRYGADQSRYFLLREVPFGNDGDFSHDHAVQRINSDLANSFGNLVQRTLSMIFKNCEAQIPQPGAFTDADQALLDKAQKTLLPEIRDEMDQQRFNKALEAIWTVIADANAYIDEQAPWKLKKTDPDRMGTVLYVLADTIRCLALLMQAFTPDSAGKILDQLGVGKNHRVTFADGLAHKLTPGTPIEKPEGVFPRIEADEEPQKKAAG